MVQQCLLIDQEEGSDFRISKLKDMPELELKPCKGKHGRLYFAPNTDILSSVKYSWIHKSCTLIIAHDICLKYMNFQIGLCGQDSSKIQTKLPLCQSIFNTHLI